MKLICLGMDFTNSNMGCQALAYSFSYLLSEICANASDNEIIAYCFGDSRLVQIPNTNLKIQTKKIKYKKFSYWKSLSKDFKSADMVVDFTAGDSFSDIYGKKRFFLDAMVKLRAVRLNKNYILGPQTYGPYNNWLVKKFVKRILKKSKIFFARDEMSGQALAELTDIAPIVTTDVAFRLPYTKGEVSTSEKIKIGINPSGLLWNGGYTGNNQFGLECNYKELLKKLISELIRTDKYKIFLFPHVGTTPDDGVENDAKVCEELKREFPCVETCFGQETPMELKSQISQMSIFLGSRMHATVGAFSSGVATIPLSYSRKFEGLYSNLGYDYVVNLRSMNTEDALKKILEYISQYKMLIDKSTVANEKAQASLNIFIDALKQIIK